MEVPMSATASRAASTTASSCVVRGNCQSRLPTTTSQPIPSSAWMVSGGSSRGAKIRTFGLDMNAPWWMARGGGGSLAKGDGGWSAAGLVELDAAILEYPTPAVQFFAHEGIEFLRRTAGSADAGILELFGNDGIGIHLDDFPLNLVDDAARRAGRRHKSDPGRNVVECGDAGFDGE